MKPLQFAVNTNTLRKNYSPSRIVALAKQVGAEGIEWGLPALAEAPSAIREMIHLTKDAGLQTVGFLNGGKLWKREEMERWAGIVGDVGGGMLRVSHPWVAFNLEESLHQRRSFPELFAMCRDAMPWLVELGRKHHVRFLLELHRGSVVASAPMAARVLEGFDPRHVGAIYDPANTVTEGHLRPRNEVELLGPHLAYVHAKNVVWVRQADMEEPVRRARWEYRTVIPSEGILDYIELFFALKASGFRGWVSVEEFFQDVPDTVGVVRDALAFLRDCAEKAPVRSEPPFTPFND